MGTHIKICGLRDSQDVKACIGADINAVGFNFYRDSKRYVEPAEAKDLVAMIPSGIETVGVFVNLSPSEVESIVKETGVQFAQLHGDEAVDSYSDIGARIVQVLHISDHDSLVNASFSSIAARLLLDTASPQYGGTGTAFDWEMVAEELVKFSVPVSIGGGLTTVNVVSMMSSLHPWGVDVASGVENLSGSKDPALVEKFVKAVRERDLRDVGI